MSFTSEILESVPLDDDFPSMENMNATICNSTDDSKCMYLDWPPKHVTQDYVQIVCLAAMFIIGAPVNTYVFYKLVIRLRRAMSRILLLQLHLCISDLIFMYVFALSEIIWLSTLEFHGGNFLCKALKFAHLFTYYLSSNIIVCISLDRVFSVTNPMAINIVAKRRVKIMTAIAWILALLCSIPQIHVWQIDSFDDFEQCIPLYKVEEIYDPANHNKTLWFMYIFFHILFVFWVPFFVIIVCYIVILYNVVNYRDNSLLSSASESSVGTNRTTITKLNIVDQRFAMHNELNNIGGSDQLIINDFVGSSYCSNNKKQWFRLCFNRNRRNINNEEEIPMTKHGLLNERSASTARLRIRRATASKTMRTTLIIVISYIICWLPYNIVTIWGILDRNGMKSIGNTMDLLYQLTVLNSVLNPFIYYKFFILETKGIIQRLF